MNAERAKIVVRGVVQGVGFRPFVYRLASELRLNGWVLNSANGVFVEIEGNGDAVRQFLLRLEKEKPLRAVIQSLEFAILDPAGYESFEIRFSEESGPKTASILPDIATCPDCLCELLDPRDRRYRYPFTNCTNCGPRFSIIEALPYDRGNTSMKKFTMCVECEHEYRDPANRRFHAQPNACPKCGPQLEFRDATGHSIFRGEQALLHAAETVRAGNILALKGLGGFQLIVDARNESAVARLRTRKHREEKPFALMAPSLDAAQLVCLRFGARATPAPLRRIAHRPTRAQSVLPASGGISGARQPVPGGDAAVHAAASLAVARTQLCDCGHQRQPKRRTHLHR